jgi:hypothetical protein
MIEVSSLSILGFQGSSDVVARVTLLRGLHFFAPSSGKPVVKEMQARCQGSITKDLSTWRSIRWSIRKFDGFVSSKVNSEDK